MKRLVPAALAAVVGLSAALVPASAEARPRYASAITFVSDRDSPSPDQLQDDVYLYDVGTGRTSRLTHDQQGETFSAISSDGRYLGYVTSSYQGVQVCRIYRQGRGWTCSSPRTLAGYPATSGRFVWAPDGRSVVIAGLEAGQTDAGIYRIWLDSFRSPRNLTEGEAGNEFQPTISPDGRFVVYSLDGDLWRRRIDGTHPVQLTNTALPAQEYGPEFSPDGKRLAFHSNRKAPVSLATDDIDIYTMSPRPEEQGVNEAVDLTADLVTPSGGPSRERFPTFSPDGRRIAFAFSDLGTPADAGRDFDAEIYSMKSSDGSDVVNLTRNNPTDPSAPPVGDIFPDWGQVRR